MFWYNATCAHYVGTNVPGRLIRSYHLLSVRVMSSLRSSAAAAGVKCAVCRDYQSGTIFCCLISEQPKAIIHIYYTLTNIECCCQRHHHHLHEMVDVVVVVVLRNERTGWVLDYGDNGQRDKRVENKQKTDVFVVCTAVFEIEIVSMCVLCIECLICCEWCIRCVIFQWICKTKRRMSYCVEVFGFGDLVSSLFFDICMWFVDRV